MPVQALLRKGQLLRRLLGNTPCKYDPTLLLARDVANVQTVNSDHFFLDSG